MTFCQKPKVIAFFTPKNDRAHISFVNEANDWFNKISRKQSFTYDTSSNWDNLNTTFLSKYQLVIFLDTRPEVLEQRQAFQKYIEDGGAWVGFHFSAFALNNSKYSQDWDWYHNQFLGSGQYKSNTWRPTSAILKIEDKNHPTSINLPGIFPSSPNEWYRWENDLRQNPDIKVLLSIDAKSFPLGTGPKPHEIWHSGDYPVVWTNTRYRMMYFNMGHNDIDYETGTNRELSHTFKNKTQNQLVINSILWLLRSNR
ncbi:MAG: ThuA domain-containing protein [Bacteroidetes bacterium]|nr:ThuA domain-containing protein [Bacteroidota bacterium]